MERGVNRVLLIGRLGQAPEVRYMPNGGGAVANFTLATSESWNDKNTGQKTERTEWHRVTLYGKLAEIAGEYLHKGSQVYIEGKLQTRKWQGQSGQDRYTTEIVVDMKGSMQILGSRQNSSQPNNQEKQGFWAANDKSRAKRTQQQTPSPDDFEDSIPF